MSKLCGGLLLNLASIFELTQPHDVAANADVIQTTRLLITSQVMLTFVQECAELLYDMSLYIWQELTDKLNSYCNEGLRTINASISLLTRTYCADSTH
jgi:hypothetical protein